jgi:UDP:flavonoid glycosyltransferase YjiC (YdhE family)
VSKLLCITSGLTGITNASQEVVRQLLDQGHQVDYGSNRDVSAKIADLGVDFIQLDEISMDPGPKVPFKGRIPRFVYKQLFSRSRKRSALAKMEPVKFEKLVKKEKYDLLLVDMELHEFIIKGHSLGFKVLLLSQWFSNWRIKGLPYLMSDEIPNQDFDFDKHWNAIDKRRKKTFIKRRLQSGGTDRYSMLPLFAKANNFPAEYIGKNYWPGPFLYNELPVLSMTAWELEFPHEPRKAMYYIGPMVNEDRREDVDPILKSRILKAKDKGQSIIYCSLSTLHAGDTLFLEKLIEAFKSIANGLLMVSLGGRLKLSEWDRNSENVIVMERMPQLFVLKQADCSINHGGIHTINECIHFSVPMLVYSGKKSDQNGCAARVEFHEIGIRGDKDKDDVKTISSKITDILTQHKYLVNIERLKQQCKRYQDRQVLSGIVNQYLVEKEA